MYFGSMLPRPDIARNKKGNSNKEGSPSRKRADSNVKNIGITSLPGHSSYLSPVGNLAIDAISFAYTRGGAVAGAIVSFASMQRIWRTCFSDVPTGAQVTYVSRSFLTFARRHSSARWRGRASNLRFYITNPPSCRQCPKSLRSRIRVRSTEYIRIAKGRWTVTVRCWWCWE
jgi:hypothetical protein